VHSAIKKSSNPKQAQLLAKFFKTGPGEYAEGDIFWGVMVPQTRKIAQAFAVLQLSEIKKLLQSPVHEVRLCALLILVAQFEKGDQQTQGKIFNFYLRHARFINNWDLVDLSAPKIVGQFSYSLIRSNKRIRIPRLEKLIQSKNLWERRIAVLATFTFIQHGDVTLALSTADQLLYDEHDLIHKATGWMLREVGKRCSVKILEQYLRPRYKNMPRTMLRYAIERMPEVQRKRYLKGDI